MVGTLATRQARSVPSNVFRPLQSVREEFENALSNLWGPDRTWFDATVPSVDLSETDKTIDVRMDLPGMKAKDIDIKVNQGVLTVSGERKEETEEKGRRFHRIERHLGSFCRSLALPCCVNESEAAAEFRDGILTITLPKAEEAKAKRIEVRS